ncbi:exopolysaccharide biosynthesis polyprenyl glycosylphosphotransferase [Cetobacterium sp.]|uniref:exopolysaccharide biosynthesis polyprenyl glycosylphosphotransferase n=1 Tax=Cetobacterium sp. TaxID=2071632 RepID=UPI003F66C4A6
MIKIMDLSINTSVYGLFLILIFSYYIFGIFTLREKYSLREFMISSILNGLIFFILLIFHKQSTILVYYLIYTFLQNGFRYILGKLYKNNIRAIILGDEEQERKVKKAIIENLEYSYLGFVSNVNSNSLGKVSQLEDIIKRYQVTEVIYLKDIEEKVLDKIFSLKLKGTRVYDSDIFLQNVEGKINVDKISKEWFLESKGFDVLTSTMDKRIKRAMDIIMSLIVLGMGLPFMILTYILVKLDNPGRFFSNPAFFYQDRIGMGGNSFRIVKFRSMRIHNPEEYSKYASKNDNRITLVGKFIRKTRLDELPQIWNVLKGDMSFVGPRPEWDKLGRDYEKKINMYQLRYAVKPGLTGWAQVMYPYGASLEDAKKKLEYDIYYIKYQNIPMDIIILFKTVKVVLFGKGI